MLTVRCGTVELDTALIISAPCLMMPPCSYCGADHVAGGVLQEQQRRVGGVGELDELGRLLRLLGEQHAAGVGQHADRVAVEARPAGAPARCRRAA